MEATRMVTNLLIVTREQPSLYTYLRQDFADDPDVVVILDRRRAERRRLPIPTPQERRRAPRRTRHDLADRLASVGFAVVPAASAEPVARG
jgi:hypothetical protein